MVTLPAIFEVDGRGEATGLVHPFCSVKCRDASNEPGDHADEGGEGCGDGSICETCLIELPL